jgi:hypothetical protein
LDCKLESVWLELSHFKLPTDPETHTISDGDNDVEFARSMNLIHNDFVLDGLQNYTFPKLCYYTYMILPYP